MREFSEIMKSGKLFDVNHVSVMNINMTCAFIHLPDCGTCRVIFSGNEGGWEHVSISPKKKHNIPSWDDMCIVKDVFFDDEEEAYQIHPKKSRYINAVENCLHLWKPIGREINELVHGTGERNDECN